MKRINEILDANARLINWLIVLIGVVLILISLLWENNTFWSTLLISVGCSILATGIVTIVTSSHMIGRREKKEILDEWGLQAIFSTKAKMNERSNECLENAKNNIDIIAIGMVNFLNVKRQLLENKLAKKVQIRIISCDSTMMLEQREIDESSSKQPTHVMKRQVKELTNWVKSLATKHDIQIKYHSTYPGFSYLRIDDHVFWGPNLPLLISQQNFAFEFSIRGEGGEYLNKYFETLWNDPDSCSDTLRF